MSWRWASVQNNESDSRQKSTATSWYCEVHLYYHIIIILSWIKICKVTFELFLDQTLTTPQDKGHILSTPFATDEGGFPETAQKNTIKHFLLT